MDSTLENAPASPFDLAPPPSGTPATQRFDAWRARFMQEVSITGGLNHPNIVPIYDVAQTPAGVPFYTMCYYAGLHTLATALEELQGKSPTDRLLLLDPFLKLCDAMHYAHSRGTGRGLLGGPCPSSRPAAARCYAR